MPAIEYVSGTESHTSYWGKFYVKGLEAAAVKEDHDDNRRDGHHSYQCYVANQIASGAVFTIFEQSGDKRGTDVWTYIICAAGAGLAGRFAASYGAGFVEGEFYEIARASGKVKAPRLMDWWDKKPSNVDPLVWAAHLRDNIDRRGVKEPPALELTTAGVAA